jgi:hypothetical protein
MIRFVFLLWSNIFLLTNIFKLIELGTPLVTLSASMIKPLTADVKAQFHKDILSYAITYHEDIEREMKNVIFLLAYVYH